MLELRSTDMLKRAQELPDNLLQQPRGLYVPVKAPPGELSATPGVADAAERSAQRARLIDQIRVQQESLPVQVAEDAFRGLVAGSLSGLALLVLRGLLTGQPDTGESDTVPDDTY
jgi:hypothetical protein